MQPQTTQDQGEDNHSCAKIDIDNRNVITEGKGKGECSAQRDKLRDEQVGCAGHGSVEDTVHARVEELLDRVY